MSEAKQCPKCHAVLLLQVNRKRQPMVRCPRCNYMQLLKMK
ncbi:MAG TPA: hypothetical protein VKM55_29540 [Candidatus Lokiarchaeia archaeon]|nr:hypothetical protein [Candidatus Lokiarchaeia archaeon]